MQNITGYIYHAPPKPTCLEVSMVNNLIFSWPKPLFFMVLGAHGICIYHCKKSRNKTELVKSYQNWAKNGEVFSCSMKNQPPEDPFFVFFGRCSSFFFEWFWCMCQVFLHDCPHLRKQQHVHNQNYCWNYAADFHSCFMILSAAHRTHPCWRLWIKQCQLTLRRYIQENQDIRQLPIFPIPSLKLTFSHLKMDGWNISFLFQGLC